MAKVATSISQLKTQLLPICKEVCDKAADKVKEVVDDFIMAYYTDGFTPSQYSRTYSFMSSCVRTETQQISNGFQAMVYINTWDLDYSDDGLDVINIINKGYHGIVGDKFKSKYKFWDDAIELLENGELSKAIGTLLNGMGLNVTYS